MKRTITALLLLLVLSVSACLAGAEGARVETPAEAFSGRWRDPYYGRAALTIVPAPRDDPDGAAWFDISIFWGSSADSAGVWRMEAVWDEAAGRLAYTDGSMTYVTYDGTGKIVEEDVQWDDAEGSFRLNEEGVLLWQDSREERSGEFALLRERAEAPSAEAFAQEYFERIAGVERGTAGASLKAALAARDALRFAFEYDLWNTDMPAMRGNMLAAWESLDDDARARFDENLFGIADLLDGAFGDYASVAGMFEDAGVGEDMARLVTDEDARRSWETLFAHTLTMGNSGE